MQNGSRIYGVVIALVRDTNDETGQGLIRVNFPWIDDSHLTDWIRIATPMAGNNRGVCFLPEYDDEALVAFEQGNPRRPIVIGFMWNAKDAKPAVDVQERRIRSKNGHTIRFIDGEPQGGSQGALVIQDGHGNLISLSNGKITIKAPMVEIDATMVTMTGPGYRRVFAGNNNGI